MSVMDCDCELETGSLSLWLAKRKSGMDCSWLTRSLSGTVAGKQEAFLVLWLHNSQYVCHGLWLWGNRKFVRNCGWIIGSLSQGL
jgi:hypothetical protein